jgi:nicotinate-nucleotide pyrophosphorylase (carboxylating)
MWHSSLKQDLEFYFSEDDLSRNFFYMKSLPRKTVSCELKIKDDMVLSGLPFFYEALKYVDEVDLDWELFEQFEGKSFKKSDKAVIKFDLPFHVALTGERIALNLLQRSSSISTFTKKFVELADGSGVKILDTRKTTPGLRSLEKYAVRMGGGFNHRYGQADVWMVKDNHKSFFGGVKEAIEFFKSQGTFYNPIEVEIHDLKELEEAKGCGVRHFMLDNFAPEDIAAAVAVKPADATFEVSGGINLDTVSSYLLPGVDAISIGSLTYAAPSVDLSLKYS